MRQIAECSMMGLVLVRIAGQTPLWPGSPLHWPPMRSPCSKH